MADSPNNQEPSVNSATKVALSVVTGKTSPLVSKTSPRAFTPWAKLLQYWESIAKSIFPTLCSANLGLDLNLFCKRWRTEFLCGGKAKIDFKISPGGIMASSNLNRPVLPPLSTTETAAVTSKSPTPLSPESKTH